MTPDQALEACLRAERGRLLAALIARTGDFQRAEDALQEASASALVHWGRAGVPHSPQGWLLRAALRKAIDGYRREGAASRHQAAMLALGAEEAALPEAPEIPDERLRLIFTCCHPALEERTRVALTLRSLCGLSTAEVAGVFLDAEPTMGQRLSRARAKIASAGIPFAVPGPEAWGERLGSVLTVIYLIFTRGHALGPAADRDLCAEAVFLARMVNDLHPGDAEAMGALALLLLTHARAGARLGPEGQTVPLLQQDRRLWSRDLVKEGTTLLDRALLLRKPGPFQIKAAIAALHVSGDGPDWHQIAALYARLQDYEPGPVVALNHAIALAEATGPEPGLARIESLGPALEGYQPFHAARAEYLSRLGRTADARAAYDRAIALAPSQADRAFLAARRNALPAD
ncbi:MAG: DUF6596 domain-containing protein [Paracoccaceae bacterium]